MRDVIDRLEALSVPTDRLLLMGGGARSAVWCQIRADLTARPVDVLAESDASSIGAALLGAVAVGIIPDVRTASSTVRHTMKAVAPDTTMTPTYQAAYHLYRERFAALEPTWSAPN